MTHLLRTFLTLLLALTSLVVAADPVIHHEIRASLDPEKGRLVATNRLTLPREQTDWSFGLHADLTPEIRAGSAQLTRVARRGPMTWWHLALTGPEPITLAYQGTIRQDLATMHEGVGRTRQWSRGTIDADGVFLSGQSGWYPVVTGGGLVTFDLEVELPADWLAVSQGTGPGIEDTRDGRRVRWQESQPQTEIYLIAGPYHPYTRPSPIAEAQVYLREPDLDLAARYLTATIDYLAFFDELIGPYPYDKFALVENFWETGYGMPSFTLLGPRVIRLPFILHTSYPHEILHNWWGNSVYVDYPSGNWSEGLTTYLADHLLRERQGRGEAYRRDTLKGYADFVRHGNDFPIRAFRSRHDDASQAIGYGKAMMVWHMLRRDLGDAGFRAGLRRFYADNRFRIADFDDLRAAFEATSGKDLGDFFTQWIERTGAPRLVLSDVRVEQRGPDARITGRLSQTQKGAPYPLAVPLIIHTEDGRFREHQVSLTDREVRFELSVPGHPVRVAADPRFDLFRQLVDGEAPVTLSELFGASQGLIVVPTGAPNEHRAAYEQLARSWSQGQSGWRVVTDRALRSLPTDRPVWLLGWENRFLAEWAEETRRFDLDLSQRLVRWPDGERAQGAEGLVLTGGDPGPVIGWLAAGDARGIASLARRVPHYRQDSFLIFDADTTENRVRGQWPIEDSALMVWTGDSRLPLSLLPSPPLTAR